MGAAVDTQLTDQQQAIVAEATLAGTLHTCHNGHCEQPFIQFGKAGKPYYSCPTCVIRHWKSLWDQCLGETGLSPATQKRMKAINAMIELAQKAERDQEWLRSARKTRHESFRRSSGDLTVSPVIS